MNNLLNMVTAFRSTSHLLDDDTYLRKMEDLLDLYHSLDVIEVPETSAERQKLWAVVGALESAERALAENDLASVRRKPRLNRYIIQ